MHKIWKKQLEEKTLQSSIAGWIMNLPFDIKAKEWLAAEERYKQEVRMKNILPAVAEEFFLDREGDDKGASILCFDEIQVKENYYIALCISYIIYSIILSIIIGLCYLGRIEWM